MGDVHHITLFFYSGEMATSFLKNTDCHAMPFYSFSCEFTYQGVCPSAFVLDIEELACKPVEDQGRSLSRQHLETVVGQVWGDREGSPAVDGATQPLLCPPAFRGQRETKTSTQGQSAETFCRAGVLKAV